MERFGFIFLVAGLGFFLLALGVSAYLPTLGVSDLTVQTVEDLAAHPPQTFLDLKRDYAAAYRKAFFRKSDEEALRELQTQAPEVFARVFRKTPEQALRDLARTHSDLFARAFPDKTVDDVAGELDFDGIEALAPLKAAAPQLYADTFDLTLAGAVATLRSDYPTTLLRIEREDPALYARIFEERPDHEVFAEALRLGHQVYIGEACWHCHSQQVRPWGNDEARYGQVSYPEEYHNELNMPPLWGTRRIGPDLIRRGGKLSNDWHVAHFWNPRDTSPYSVMPRYPWFFDDDGMTPNKKGLAIIAYVQWLGSWQDTGPAHLHRVGEVERAGAGLPLPHSTGGER